MRQVINKITAIDFNNLKEKQHFGEIYEQILNDLQSAGNAGEYHTPRAVTAFMADRIDPRPGESSSDPACGTGGFLTCSIRHMRERYVKTVDDERQMQQGLLQLTGPRVVGHQLGDDALYTQSARSAFRLSFRAIGRFVCNATSGSCDHRHLRPRVTWLGPLKAIAFFLKRPRVRPA